MTKIEKPEDVVVVSRRRWMQLSSLAAAGSVMLGGLELGAKEPQYSRERASAGPHDSDAIFGGEEASATTGWEIIAAWLALTTRPDKLGDCLLYRGQNGECSKIATEDLNLNDAGWRQARNFLLANRNCLDQLIKANEVWHKLAHTYNSLYPNNACPYTSQIRELARGLS